MATLDEVLIILKKNNRVCPIPLVWQKLYDLLPNKKRGELGWMPPLPLILTAWHYSNDEQKSSRIREHIEWADKNNYIEKIYNFLSSLSEDEWHHKGE